MIVSTDSEKVFNKIQHSFMINALKRLGIEGTYLSIIKGAYNKPTDNIVLNGEKLKALPLKSEIIKGCPLFPILFNTVIESLDIIVRQGKKIKRMQIRKKSQIIPFFRYYTTLKRP
jgi:hypothetical protein